MHFKAFNGSNFKSTVVNQCLIGMNFSPTYCPQARKEWRYYQHHDSQYNG